MLGEKIADITGKVTTRRVLPAAGGGVQVETSFEATGKVLGIELTEIGTYVASMQPTGVLFGEGQGVIMTKDGETVTWKGQGFGKVLPDGGTSFRGSLYHATASTKLARLNSVVGVFEWDTDAQGNTKGSVWEWR